MKNLIFLVVLGVAGYFAYQYFGIPWLESNNSPQSTFNMYSLPENCQRAGENLQNAFLSNKKGEIVKAQVNGYASTFRGCLRRSGYTASEIKAAYDGIADSAGYKGW
jgi:hypothetical protein